jgi:Uma2 family endonuclease
MSTVFTQSTRYQTLRDLLNRLGDIPPARIRVDPAFGTATPADVLRLQESEGVLCELVDGFLVEKPMGSPESYLTLRLARLLGNYVEQHDLGYLLGPDGMTRLFPKLVRLPDISFTSWERAPSREGPSEAITTIIPNLVVEVFSPGNTEEELKVKRREYFRAGVELVWQVYRDTRTVYVYTPGKRPRVLGEGDILTGDPVIPGFRLKLSELFARVPKGPEQRPKKRKKR